MQCPHDFPSIRGVFPGAMYDPVQFMSNTNLSGESEVSDNHGCTVKVSSDIMGPGAMVAKLR